MLSIQKRLYLLVLLLVSSLSSGAALPRPPAIVPESVQTYLIKGVIASGNILEISQDMLKRANNKDQVNEPVNLVISSPGGSVATGFIFLSQMRAAQAKGLVVRCYVPDFAASMAFGIYTACNERYALSRAFLLWHRARIFFGGFNAIAMTAPLADHISFELSQLDASILRDVVKAMDMHPEDISYHFENETLHLASGLASLAPGFMQAVDFIPGLLESSMNSRVMSSGDGGSDFRDGDIIYISDRLSR